MSSDGEALLESIRKSNFNSVQKLILANADPDLGNFYMTPLSLAIIENQIDAFNLLLSQGANVNLELCGGTPMRYAIKYGRLDMLERLHKEGAHYHPSYLEAAITERQIETAKFFLENCPNDMKSELVANDYYMYKALLYNSVELVRLLREHGWQYNVCSEENEPVLIQLAKYDAHKVVKELGESGTMDFNVRDRCGMTPLLWSADYMVGTATMKEILTYGASVNQGCRLAFETALYLCAQRGNLEKVKMLICNGADPNLRNCYGESPLDAASACGHEKIVQYLLEAGAIATSDTNMLRQNVAGVITVHRKSVKPLQHMARLSIRARMFQNNSASKLDSLPLPKSVKKYLSFDESESEAITNDS